MASFPVRSLARLLLASLLVGWYPARAADFQLLARHPIPGEGGWDYLAFDVATKHLFVTRGDRVQVVDPADGRLVGTVEGTPGVHGVALAPDLGKGYASNGRDRSVTVFDAATLRTLGRIPAGDTPDAIVYEPATRRVVAMNGRSHDATVIDATTDRSVATVALGGKPESAVSDGRGTVFVDIEDTNEVVALDALRGTVLRRWRVAGCDEPAGLAIDTVRRRLFVGCHNQTLVVLDADGGRVLATLPIGRGVDANAFDPAIDRAFSSQGDGTLTIVHEPSPGVFAVEQTVATERGARTMAFDPVAHRAYLVTASYDESPAVAGERPKRTMRPGSFVLLVYGVRD